MSAVVVNISDGIATITFNRPKSLNAITASDYNAFANALREINERDDIIVTIWQATGKWFCAGTDVKGGTSSALPNAANDIGNIRQPFITKVSKTTLDCGQALYSHRKILVAALNGPVMGIAAAFLGYFDFIYAMPNAWLSVPFTFIGIIAEGGSSVSFAKRMGLAKANEVLIWGKKKNSQELSDCGFINKIFPQQTAEAFHNSVRNLILEELKGLDPAAILTVKSLIKAGLNEQNNPDAVNLRESYAQAERFASGIPAKQFARIAKKEIKHKL